jgi:hypothetical protein
MTKEELNPMVNSMSANQMVNTEYVVMLCVQSTNQYWYQQLQELLALIEQKGCPAFYLHLVQLTAIGQIYKACYRMRKVHSPPDWSFI